MILEKLSYENVEKCFDMKLEENQKTYVANNALSLAMPFWP